MKLNVYGIRDAKTEAFHTPFYARTDGEAKRMFINSSETGNFAKHHADYQLFNLAIFDDNDGSFTPTVPIMIMTGTEAHQLANPDATKIV